MMAGQFFKYGVSWDGNKNIGINFKIIFDSRQCLAIEYGPGNVAMAVDVILCDSVMWFY